MKKLISLSLAVLLILTFSISLYGCEETGENSDDISEAPVNESSESEESKPMIIISNDPAYANVTSGKSYTTSGLYPDNASASYPDEGNKSLTDGVRPANTASYSDKTFVGFNKTARSYVERGYSSVTVDLGGIYYLDKFVANVGSAYHIDVGISAPEFVSVYLSNDGNDWYKAGDVECIDSEETSSIDVTLTLDSALTARYVEYRLVGGGNWIMLAETEAYGIPAEEALAYPEVSDRLDFLFIGNSSTYFFNVPHKFQAICKAAGIDIEIEYCCVGGAYLSQYANESDESCGKLLRSKLAQKKYDYIVVQDNSNADYSDSKPAMDIIVPLIKENGAEILLYKRYSSNEDPAKRPDSAYRHHLNYTQLAKDFEVSKVAPVADAFLICQEKYPNANIYHTDNSHHSHEGAYLIACVWAITYFDIDISNSTYTAGLDTETLNALRESAKLACEEGYDFPQDNK